MVILWIVHLKALIPIGLNRFRFQDKAGLCQSYFYLRANFLAWDQRRNQGRVGGTELPFGQPQNDHPLSPSSRNFGTYPNNKQCEDRSRDIFSQGEKTFCFKDST
jgi:hypothetical protein